MLYPLSYRRKARVVYRGEAGVATGVGQARLCGVPGVTWELLPSRGCLAEAVTGPAANPRPGPGFFSCGDVAGACGIGMGATVRRTTAAGTAGRPGSLPRARRTATRSAPPGGPSRPNRPARRPRRSACEGPPRPASSRTFPGSPARCKFDVSAHTTTVATREWLKTSSRTTTWGWGWPGTGPRGSSGPTQNTSPRSILAERVPVGSPLSVFAPVESVRRIPRGAPPRPSRCARGLRRRGKPTPPSVGPRSTGTPGPSFAPGMCSTGRWQVCWCPRSCAGSVEQGGGTTYDAGVRIRGDMTGRADCMHIFLPVRKEGGR